MRIGIDVRSLSKPKTGIGYYTYNLVKNLLKLDRDNEYYLYSCREFDGQDFSNTQIRTINFPIGTLWVQSVLPFMLTRDKIDLFHSPEAMAPLFSRCPTVVTVLDLIPILFPKGHDPKANLAGKFYPLVFRHAHKLISISDSTKRDLIKVCKIPESKIETIYLAADIEIYRPLKDEDVLKRIKNKYALARKYILTVGVLSPRKNLSRLIEAYSILKRKCEMEIDLVIAGPPGWQYEELYAAVEKLALDKNVHFLGAVPPQDLPLIYNAAELFVYPSLYEGFGLPILEAMACGIPVITSNISSMPEVAGEAALRIDPYKTEAIAEAIEKLLNDQNQRNQLIAKGFERVKQFSWQKCAQETLAVYKEVAACTS